MLSFKNRLKKKKDIENVFKKGETTREGLLVLKKIKSGSKDTRFCFVINSTSFRKATSRNRIKRILREIVRKKIGQLRQGLDVILIVRPGSERMDLKQLENNVDKIFLKSNI